MTCKHHDILLRPDNSSEQYYYRHGIHEVWKRRVTGPDVSRRLTVLSQQQTITVTSDLVVLTVNGEDAVHYRLSDEMSFDKLTNLWHFKTIIPIRLSNNEVYYLRLQGREKELSAMHRRCSTKFVGNNGSIEYFRPRDMENFQTATSGYLIIDWLLEYKGAATINYR